MPTSMTRAQYQQTYGTPPPVSGGSQTPPVQAPQSAPVSMTRAQYQTKYGQAPAISNDAPATPQPQHSELGNALGDVAGAVKSVGNFLFPIIGDVGDDLTGKNKKTALQQVGDLGVSALPFIPGLGEAGEAARGAELGGEAADSGNLASKAVDYFKGSPVLKGAAAGYGGGVSQNLSQGKGIGESLAPNVNTVLGSVLGGALPAVFKGVGALRNEIAGINPQIRTELERMGSKADPADAQLYDQYIKSTKAHAVDMNKPSALQLGADKVDESAQILQKKVDKAGQNVGIAKENAKSIPLKPMNNVGNSFWKDVQDKYGLNLFNKKDGSVVAKKIGTSMIDTSPADVSRITDIAQQLSDLNNGKATAKNATEVMENIRKYIGDSVKEGYGERGTQFQGLMKHTAANLNDTIRQSSSGLAKANDVISDLYDLQDETAKMAGKNTDKGALLMRRAFSGDKSGEVQDFFGKMKNATGIDLQKHAILIKHAIDSVGGENDKTLLAQYASKIEEGKTLGMSGLNLAKTGARKMFGFGNPEGIGRNLVKGKSNILQNLINSKGGIPAKVGAEGSRYLTSFLNR